MYHFSNMKKFASTTLLTLALISFSSTADIVSDWNIKAREIVVESKLYTPPANSVMAIVHTSIYESVNSITKEFPKSNFEVKFSENSSLDASIAAATYTSLLALLPKQKARIEKEYQAALKLIADGLKKDNGIAVGKATAEMVLALRANDGSKAKDSYRPLTSPGKYVPTVIPAVPHWPNRKPWLLKSGEQFRAGPPPALNSDVWARDFNEVKQYGASINSKRSKEQSEIAKFWEATLPPIYHGVVHSVANQPGRSITQNSRLFALVTQACDDALIAVFDAKYHYNFWRPITAIRNADLDGNSQTEQEINWKPYISTPMHPEYPCAHCVVAGTVGTILKAEIGDNPTPILTTQSATANGVTRSWKSIEDFIAEVSNARIYDGVHYRASTEAGTAMGIKIGKNAVKKF